MDFLDKFFLDNPIRNLLSVTGIIIFVLLFRRLLSRYVASLLFIFVHKNWKTVEKKEFIGLIIKPLGWFLTILISVFAIDKLSFPSDWNFSIYGLSFEVLLQRIGLCLISIYFIWVVLSLIDFVALILDQKAKLTKDKRDDQLIVFFRDFFKAIVYILSILLILRVGFNRNIGAILTGLSIVGAAMALAAKESIENLIASFIIFFDKPFFTGDTVKVNNVTGSVEHIGLRSTRIRTIDKTLVTVPNKQMVDSVVDNWSMRTDRRAEIKIEFDHSISTAALDKFTKDIKQFLEQHTPPVTKHSVFITEYNKSGVTVTIEYYTQPFTMAEFNELKQQFNLFTKKTMEESDLKMASSGNDINIFSAETGENITKSKPII
ncbi:MAG: mechanosensitive ion channel family protein [Ferruginibacter sp.]